MLSNDQRQESELLQLQRRVLRCCFHSSQQPLLEILPMLLQLVPLLMLGQFPLQPPSVSTSLFSRHRKLLWLQQRLLD